MQIVRVGQVGGSNRGHRQHVWADQPWISAIIRTSKTLGTFPSPVVPIDWVSVDDVATILHSVIVHQSIPVHALRVFNVVSEPQSWNVLVDAVRQLSGSAAVANITSLPDWVGKVWTLTNTDSKDMAENLPALRLLDFYKGLGNGRDCVKYETGQSRSISGLDLAAVDQDLLVSWLETWKL